jgi:hypothetical protein
VQEEAEEEEMKELAADELAGLFEGAPQFSLVMGEPVVSFPFGGAQDGVDFRSPGHPVFALSYTEEMPLIRTFQGYEPGTVGWSYFLTSGLREETDDDGAEGKERGGVRSVEVAYIVERLKELGNELELPQPVEMYTHLFTHLLYPPTRITTEDFQDPYSLKVQIVALIQVLAKKRVWLDFADVAWRIRLGQILWGGSSEEEAEVKESGERVWLLLQVLLACELLVRMDAVLRSDDEAEKEQLLRRFREAGGGRWGKVELDLVLARRWLDNIRIVELDTTTTPPAEKEPEKSKWWFSTSQPEELPPPTPPEVTDALLLPRHPGRQVEGLLLFARSIGWPNVDALAQQVIAKATPGPTPAQSVYGTPMTGGGTPVSVVSSSSNSYFTSPKPARTKGLREQLTSELQRQKSMTAATGGGWLSRSYLTGLILPGEGLNHLLICTLLENDPAAVEVLGYNANLYGGFQYLGKTWWSRYCIVGRVMAGYDGAGEQCGWVGPVIASGMQVQSEDGEITVGSVPDGWIDVVTAPSPDLKAPRALEAKLLARDGDVRGRNWWKNGTTELQWDAFEKVPVDKVDDEEVQVDVRGLYFNPVEPEEDDLRSYEVIANFLVGPKDGMRRLYELDLRFDVSFVAAWPCSGDETGHRLHTSFAYAFLRLEELDADSSVEDAEKKNGTVAVVNTWTPEQRVFVYAWCAHKGRSAVVARRGRTCIACAIREASALRLEVVVVV